MSIVFGPMCKHAKQLYIFCMYENTPSISLYLLLANIKTPLVSPPHNLSLPISSVGYHDVQGCRVHKGVVVCEGLGGGLGFGSGGKGKGAKCVARMEALGWGFEWRDSA